MKKTILMGILLIFLIGCTNNSTKKLNDVSTGYFTSDECNLYSFTFQRAQNENAVLYDCIVCDYKYRTYGKQRYMAGCKEYLTYLVW